MGPARGHEQGPVGEGRKEGEDATTRRLSMENLLSRKGDEGTATGRRGAPRGPNTGRRLACRGGSPSTDMPLSPNGRRLSGREHSQASGNSTPGRQLPVRVAGARRRAWILFAPPPAFSRSLDGRPRAGRCGKPDPRRGDIEQRGRGQPTIFSPAGALVACRMEPVRSVVVECSFVLHFVSVLRSTSSGTRYYLTTTTREKSLPVHVFLHERLALDHRSRAVKCLPRAAEQWPARGVPGLLHRARSSPTSSATRRATSARCCSAAAVRFSSSRGSPCCSGCVGRRGARRHDGGAGRLDALRPLFTGAPFAHGRLSFWWLVSIGGMNS
jgi:hypothetical protein